MPSEYERQLKEELWGCFKYIGIPYETLLNMPIQDRRFYIMKHNAEQEEIEKRYKKDNGGGRSYNGDLNAYARREQDNAKTRGGQF